MLEYFLQYELIFLFRIPKEDKAKSMFGPPRVYAEGEKVRELYIEKIIGKVFLQIQIFEDLQNLPTK